MNLDNYTSHFYAYGVEIYGPGTRTDGPSMLSIYPDYFINREDAEVLCDRIADEMHSCKVIKVMVRSSVS